MTLKFLQFGNTTAKKRTSAFEAAVRSDEAHVARITAWFESQGGRDYVSKECFVEVRNEEIFNTVP